jgi:hypothetical protein
VILRVFALRPPRTDGIRTWDVGVGGDTVLCVADMGRPRDLAEGERVGLGAWIGESDLEDGLSDRPALANELVGPLLRDRAVAIAVYVGSVGLAGPDHPLVFTVLEGTPELNRYQP